LVGQGAAASCGASYALVPLVPVAGGLFALVNELWLTWDPGRQYLHDKAAHTVVIKKNYQFSRPQAGAWWRGEPTRRTRGAWRAGRVRQRPHKGSPSA
jgi:hypothetical protein